jgi:hypothetical protein
VKTFSVILLASTVAFTVPVTAHEFEPAPVYLPLIDVSSVDVDVAQALAAIKATMAYPDSLRIVELRTRPTADIVGNPNGHVLCGHFTGLDGNGDGRTTGPIQFYTLVGDNASAKAWIGPVAGQACLDAGF